ASARHCLSAASSRSRSSRSSEAYSGSRPVPGVGLVPAMTYLIGLGWARLEESAPFLTKASVRGGRGRYSCGAMAQGRTTHGHRRVLDRRVPALTPLALAIAVIILAGADWGTRLAGDTLLPGGPLDEVAHLLTTLIVFWALSSRARERFLVPALIASVAIDI